MSDQNNETFTTTLTTKLYGSFAEKLEDYKLNAHSILANLNFRFRFMARNQLDSEPIIEIWDDEVLLIQAGLLFHNGQRPVMFHLCNCGQAGPEHNHQIYGRQIHTNLDVYRSLLDEVNLLRLRQCILQNYPV